MKPIDYLQVPDRRRSLGSVRHSPLRGGPTSTSSMDRGLPASQATAALHVMVSALDSDMAGKFSLEDFTSGRV